MKLESAILRAAETRLAPFGSYADAERRRVLTATDRTEARTVISRLTSWKDAKNETSSAEQT
jgi:hypothetical protein